MKRDLLNELFRIKEMMGLRSILEQTDLDERIFVSLLDDQSKIYWNTAGQDMKCSPKYYFKYKFPKSELNPREEKTTSKEGYEGEYLYRSYNYIPSGYIKKDSKYYQQIKELSYIKDQNGKSLGEKKSGFSLENKNEFLNTDYNESSLKICSSYQKTENGQQVTIPQKRTSGAEIPPMTEEIKNGFIEYFKSWCLKNDQEELSKCRQIVDYIRLKPGGLSTTKPTEEEVIPAVAWKKDINGNVTGEPFVNNSTEIGNGVKDWVTSLKSSITEFLEKNPGANVSIANKVNLGEGLVDYPFTISTSASRFRNMGPAENLSFKELSEARSQNVYNYLVVELKGLIPDIDKVKVVLNSNGTNGDGSSGPNPPYKNDKGQPYKFSTGGGLPNTFTIDDKKYDRKSVNGQSLEPHTTPQEYEQYKYCIIQLAVQFDYESRGITEPTTPSKLGEWSIKVVPKRDDGDGGKNKMTWRRIKSGGGNFFYDNGGLPCDAYL